MSQDHVKHSITIAKHIPSGEQFVPADALIVSDSWDDDSTDYLARFNALESKANTMIRQWTSPAKKAVKSEEAPAPAIPEPKAEAIPEPSPEAFKADNGALRKAAEAAVLKVPWKAYQGTSDADKFARGKTEPGWASAYHDAAPIVEWMKGSSSPWIIAVWAYTISKDGAFIRRKRVTP